MACSTPVFQYALENWSADSYELVVAVNGLAEDEVRATAEAVLGGADGGTVNARLRLRQDAALPAGAGRLEVRLPHHPSTAAPLWSAPWSPEALRQAVESAVRVALAEALLRPGTIAFLFLPSGRAEADAQARARLQEALDELARTLVPSVAADTAVDDAAAAAPSEPPRVRFRVIEVPIADSSEAFLRQLLLATEPDLRDLKEPMAFPVFGRGRVLYAIAGQGINREVLTESCVFLTGACSCLVKAQNPGVDLLMRGRWEPSGGPAAWAVTELPPLSLPEVLAPSAAPVAAEVSAAAGAVAVDAGAGAAGVGAAHQAAAETAPVVPAPVMVDRRERLALEGASGRLRRRVLLIAGAALVVVVAGSLAILRRRALV
ncbi:MAG: hypothetical protein GX595_08340 [Lentisphaerae bacterium]|nr:hypothetical protein [Lentisphaerota bacterium]